MAVGFQEASYPFVLARQSIWPDGGFIENASLAGFTTADACSFFFDHYKKFQDFHSVIIYLGNCDTQRSELSRGKSTWLHRKTTELQRLLCGPRKVHLNNKLMYFEWNNQLNPTIEKELSPEDFDYNIRKIVEFCSLKGLKVILINPVPNYNFLSGLGKGNFVFYHYFGFRDNISSHLKINDTQFLQAYKDFELGDFGSGRINYSKILKGSSAYRNDPEFNYLIAQNYAICCAELGLYDEAIFLLNILSKDQAGRPEIALYNLGLIERKIKGKGISGDFRQSI